MSDEQRIYSDEEFALILRRATELASEAESTSSSSTGLTLAEMKSAAAQAGIEPALVERAARTLVAARVASPLERVTGGPLKHTHEVRFPIKLDEKSAALLLSAVRVRAGLAGHRDIGHSSSMGMTWHDGGGTEALGVTAHPEDDGTIVSLTLDRRGTLGVVAMASGISMFLLFLFAVFGLYPESHALGIGGLIVGLGGPLAAARGYWASSTRKARERIGVVMDAIGKTLSQIEARGSVSKRIKEDNSAADSE